MRVFTHVPVLTYLYFLFRITKYILNRVAMWILTQLLHLAGQTTTITPVFSGPVVCAFPELFHQLVFYEQQIHCHARSSVENLTKGCFIFWL